MQKDKNLKLFILLSRIPFPLDKGDKLRAYNQIKDLAKYYNITLCALKFNKNNDNQAFKELEKYCDKIVFINIPFLYRIYGIFQVIFSKRPFQTGFFYNTFTSKRVNNEIKKSNPDVIYCQLVRTAPFLSAISIPKIIDYQDALSLGMLRRANNTNWLYKKVFYYEYKRLLKYESEIFDTFAAKCIISETDRDNIKHKNSEEIEIIRNGVDFDYYNYQTIEKQYDIIFSGNMGYAPNIDACDFLVNDIMPIVWKKMPNVKLVLAGTNPSIKVKSLKSSRVIITGFVDDLRPLYAASKIFIAPMRLGSGLQNKILEAMAIGIPCITSVLANKALKASHNEHIIECESVIDYASAIIELLSNEKMRIELSQKASIFIKDNYDWQTQNEKLNKLIIKTYENAKK